MLPEADYSITSQAMGLNNQNNMSHAVDTSGLLVKFYKHPYLNKNKKDAESYV